MAADRGSIRRHAGPALGRFARLRHAGRGASFDQPARDPARIDPPEHNVHLSSTPASMTPDPRTNAKAADAAANAVDGAIVPSADAPVTALVADDEPLLRERLVLHLQRLWPALQVVGQARNGREALELFDQHQPQVVFLDVHMPGMSGIDAARGMAGRCEIVFITAYEQYAVQAFERGALDYLVKPFDEARLAETVLRLQHRLQALSEARQHRAATAAALPGKPEAPAGGRPLDDLLDRLASALHQRAPARSHLQWIKASVGPSLRLIPVAEVAYLRSDEKYTLVVWEGGEALIRKTIRELADELDPEVFVQVHRSAIVNLRQVAQVVRGANDTADVHLRGRKEVLPVSRSYLHVFRQM
jgi:DNA-binding LytR/AlgR family response regulator